MAAMQLITGVLHPLGICKPPPFFPAHFATTYGAYRTCFISVADVFTGSLLIPKNRLEGGIKSVVDLASLKFRITWKDIASGVRTEGCLWRFLNNGRYFYPTISFWTLKLLWVFICRSLKQHASHLSLLNHIISSQLSVMFLIFCLLFFCWSCL